MSTIRLSYEPVSVHKMFRKSQIAIEYSYQVRERRPEAWVFWIHASSAARFMQGIREIADAVKLSERMNPTADILRSLHNWLHDERKGKWLLILDNVDDATFLLSHLRDVPTEDSGYSRRLIDYLPPSRHGAILVTSRIKSEARKLIEESDIVTVSPMQELEAQQLFQGKLGSDPGPNEAAEAAKLVAALEFMPLAIVQAASYIREKQPRCSIHSYLDLFSRNLSEKTALLAHEAGGLRRDPEAKNSILLTWHISFEHLRKVRPSAADLLSFMCFFDRQGISTRLLQRKGKPWRTEITFFRWFLLIPRRRMIEAYEPTLPVRRRIKSSPAEVDSKLENDILVLRNYLFITSRDDDTFEIHRLVQLATRAWLQKQRELRKWSKEFITTLWLDFPDHPDQPWRICQELYPHVRSASAQPPMMTNWLQRLRWFHVLLRAADFAGRSGNMIEAESMYMQAYELAKRGLGPGPSDSETVTTRFANSLRDVGRYEEAEAMHRQLVERSLGICRPKRSRRVYRMIPIADLLSLQNKHAEAERIYRRSLRHFEQKLGANHLDTLHAARSLGNALIYQEKYEEAETMLRRALTGWEKVLGPGSFYATVDMISIGRILGYHGKNEAAVTMFQRALTVNEERLGSDHPNVLNVFLYLGMALGDRGKHAEAETLFRRALAGFEKIMGSRLNLRTSLVYLSLALALQNKWAEAEACIRREIAEVEKEPRLRDCYALDSTTKLAYVLEKQGQPEQADSVHQRAGAAGSGSCVDTNLLRSWVQLKEN